MTPARVDFITNIAPHYRGPLWRRLLNNDQIDASFIFGKSDSSSIKPINFGDLSWQDAEARIVSVRNIYLGGVLVWQFGVLKRILKTDAQAVVLLGQIYIISMWMAALIARLRGIRVIFWGHGAYGRETWFKSRVIKAFLSLADKILVYGEHARSQLIEWGLSPNRVQTVYNSLDHATHLALRTTLIDSEFYETRDWFDNCDAPVLVFVGRLTKQKQLDRLIESVNKLSVKGHIFNLIFVGDGPERQALQSLATPLSGQIYFYGACYDKNELARVIANADLCVSPGEVGLTAIHCLSYGTPVCTHDDMASQMPEAEAIVEGRTGVLFDRQRMDVAGAIQRWFEAVPDRQAVREACYREIDKKWNTENQVRIMTDAIRSVCGDPT